MPDPEPKVPSGERPADPSVEFREQEGRLIIVVGGTWLLRQPRPVAGPIIEAIENPDVRSVTVTAENLGQWDTSLMLQLLEIRRRARDRNLPVHVEGFPEAVSKWIDVAEEDTRETPSGSLFDYDFPITRKIGLATQQAWFTGTDMTRFLGESVLSLGRIPSRPPDFHWSETLVQMRRCGAQALPIVGLISFLVGVILAFVAAMQLRQFGADVFVANLVGLAVVREMGPMMAAIVLAGRTGAAYAAELGNMRLNEEIDALETFGINPHNFLVAPRMAALILMMPLLAIYANLLGIGGGIVVSQTVLDVAPVTFYNQLRGAVGLNDLGTGLLKSFFFGLIVAYSGCLKGMRATRSSVGVGEATTDAVVLAILLIIVADAAFTVLFNALDW